ncbi:glutathione S-transferase [Sphaerulina musiva SO2202]|uniref:Glutathione S-transferase n=1 Tax=Sphaerulina musiva (strain SO2202) TaxID=692275 RepID=M3D458_SPHMS|nr:glutathione S-transferase [Sphaerulina musiva SO2202]EMF12975.1 glutathione S-transferase [Sphaerulina musiva SO2202]
MAPPTPQETDIELYTAGTPNGQKISITLEELGVKYNVNKVDIAKNVQKEDWFLKINPNGRIPAIVDKTSKKSGKPVFEGSSIQLYLTAKYDPEHRISFPYDSDEYWEVVEWMTWMQSGLGPMQGQANHFYRYAPTRMEYAINRYQTETKRLYQVLEERLKMQSEGGKKPLYIVGNKYTIADICIFSWVNWAEWAGISLEPYPHVKAWLQNIQERPAVEKGVNVPEKFEMKEAMKTKEGEEEYAKHHSNWVIAGQNEDAKRHQ